ncbi:MAG: Ig-like domain repeat protein, partial [Verrucomicrobiota bacterium]
MSFESTAGRSPVNRGWSLLLNPIWSVCLLLPVLAGPLRAQNYSPPANSRQDIILDTNWLFIQTNLANAQEVNFDDSSWTNINLPHTWDIPDGQSYPSSAYYTGIAWYRTRFTVANTNGLHFFLKFDGAYLVADVYVNGIFMGEHDGGFAAFVFDVTPYVGVGATNLIAIEVNNSVNDAIPPLDGDFTKWGGIYRDVHLLVTDPVQVSPLDYGSPGVYLMPTSVSASSANLQVTTVLSNASPAATNVMLRTVITDAATNIVTTLTNLVTLQAGSGSNVVAGTTIANPHLWNGLSDPYLYQAFVEVWKGGNVVDLVAQPLGFRYFNMDPTNGFFLNGAHYDLHGVSMHQDWLNCGWALTNAQVDTNFMFIKEVGATAVRLPHYQHSDYTYTLGDSNGVILWSEVPNIEGVPATYTNLLRQLHEMILQVFNHPSVVCWGMYNEILAGTGSTNIIAQEVQLAHALDPTRPTTAASNVGVSDVTTLWTDVIAFNEYYGWYDTPIDGLAAFMDGAHASYPNRPTGLSEYGAGGSIIQHSENPVAWPTTDDGPFHPEEWQNLVHETNWPIIQARPYLWTKFVWNLFDFASDARDEGDIPGRNDKGLVTYDRQTRKDVFYYYKANWTTNPTVYITGHTFTNRLTNFVTAKVYANCDTVQLYLNGISQGAVASTNCVFTWPATLISGSNYVLAVGSKSRIQVTDSLSWIAPVVPSTTTTLVLSTGASPCAYGTLLAFQATVRPSPPNGETVTFYSGATVIGTAALTGGVASLSLDNLPYNPSPQSISVAYPGDPNYLASTSAALSQTVNQATLTYVANPVSRLLGATNPVLSGVVTGFVNGETQAGATTGTLAFVTTAATSSPAGSYPIDGSGLLASNYTFVQAAGNATALTIATTATTTTIALAAGANPCPYGASLTFQATVSPTPPNGEAVDFYSGAAAIGAAATSGGVASLTLTNLPYNPSAQSITAAYSGDSVYVASTSAALSQTLTRATLTYVANRTNRSVGAANPPFSGTVTGFVNGDTQASATTGTLVFTTTATTSSPAGSYPINGSGLSAYSYTFAQAAGNATALTITIVSGPGNDTWNGAGADNNWQTALNWSAGSANSPPISGDALFFGGTARLNPNNNFPTATSFNGLTFNPGAGAYVLGGNSITTTGQLADYAASAEAINLPITLSGSQNMNVASGGSMTVNGQIAGTDFGVTKTGGGILTLTGEAAGANTYTGATAVNAGALVLDFTQSTSPAANIISASSPLSLGGG